MSRSIIKTIHINASKNEVFDSLITPNAIKKWWGAESVILIPKVGGPYTISWGKNIDRPSYVTYSVISTYEDNEKLVLEYRDYISLSGNLPFEANFIVSFNLKQVGKATKLEVRQDGFPNEQIANEYFNGCSNGWDQVLLNIKMLLESPYSKYRDEGAKGALLDEYEKAVNELISIIEPVTKFQLITIVDHETSDEDCRSIQTILTHVVNAGHGYTFYIAHHLNEQFERKSIEEFDAIADYQNSLKAMFNEFLALFNRHSFIPFEEHDSTDKFKVGWGQLYDIEQLVEHAIVHILRHRRQIERFLLKLNTNKPNQ